MHERSNKGISINECELMDFMKNSSPVFLPLDNLGKRKLINKVFHGSCMMVRVAEHGYLVGELNWTDATGYSITVKGKENHFLYSETEAIFKPKLC